MVNKLPSVAMDVGIYKITNLVNQKVYIGQSRCLQNRLNQHRSYLKNNKHKNLHLQRSYNKYGIENFKFEVIHYVDHVKELSKWEEYYINTYQSYLSNYGFNIIRIINEVTIHSEETRLKLSKSNTGKKRKPEDIEKQIQQISKKSRKTNTTGQSNIFYIKKDNAYLVEFRERDNRFNIGQFQNIQFAVLIRDLFFEYTNENREAMKNILKQCKSSYGYFCVTKEDGKYLTRVRNKSQKSMRLKRCETKEEAATSYNQFILENNINKPLNIIPFDKGIWNNNQWYCDLS